VLSTLSSRPRKLIPAEQLRTEIQNEIESNQFEWGIQYPGHMLHLTQSTTFGIILKFIDLRSKVHGSVKNRVIPFRHIPVSLNPFDQVLATHNHRDKLISRCRSGVPRN